MSPFSAKTQYYFKLLLQKAKSFSIKLFALSKVYYPIIKSYFFQYKWQLLKFFFPVFLICIGMYSCSVSKANIANNMHDIFEIADEVRSYYLDKPDYWGVSTQSVIDNKVISTKFIKENKIILSGGAEILIGNGENGDIIMPFSQSFDIILRGLNKAQCISYSEMVWEKDKQLALISINIINSSGNYIFEWGGTNPLPIQKYATKDFCINSENTIIWSIK